MLQKLCVEFLHQFRGRFIVHFPQTGQNARCAGIHESPNHAHETLTFDFLAKCGVTGTEHDEFSSEVQVSLSAERVTLLEESRTNYPSGLLTQPAEMEFRERCAV